jgi:hypothetical protein
LSNYVVLFAIFHPYWFPVFVVKISDCNFHNFGVASFNESTESIEQEPEQDSPNENDPSMTSDIQVETDDGAPEDDDACVVPKPALRFAQLTTLYNISWIVWSRITDFLIVLSEF